MKLDVDSEDWSATAVQDSMVCISSSQAMIFYSQSSGYKLLLLLFESFFGQSAEEELGKAKSVLLRTGHCGARFSDEPTQRSPFDEAGCAFDGFWTNTYRFSCCAQVAALRYLTGRFEPLESV